MTSNALAGVTPPVRLATACPTESAALEVLLAIDKKSLGHLVDHSSVYDLIEPLRAKLSDRTLAVWIPRYGPSKDSKYILKSGEFASCVLLIKFCHSHIPIERFGSEEMTAPKDNYGRLTEIDLTVGFHFKKIQSSFLVG